MRFLIWLIFLALSVFFLLTREWVLGLSPRLGISTPYWAHLLYSLIWLGVVLRFLMRNLPDLLENVREFKPPSGGKEVWRKGVDYWLESARVHRPHLILLGVLVLAIFFFTPLYRLLASFGFELPLRTRIWIVDGWGVVFFLCVIWVAVRLTKYVRLNKEIVQRPHCIEARRPSHLLEI